jgi:hypothetical protein
MGVTGRLATGRLLACVCTAALIGLVATPARASTTCSKLPGRTIVKDADWRVFDKSKEGVRRYKNTVRHSLRVCRRGTTTVRQVAAWTDSKEDSTKVEHKKIVGDWAAIAGRYTTGVAAGTFVQVIHLSAFSRTRIEGPLADRLTALHLSAAGSAAVETLASGIPSLDAYDRTGRRTLATGSFSEAWIGGNQLQWREPSGIRAVPLDGPATNDPEAFADF